MVTIKFPETDLIGCRFPEVTGRNGELMVDQRSKKYLYRVLPGMVRPKVGDMCVVSCSNGFQVAIVVTLDETLPATWDKGEVENVVGFVDYEYYKQMLETKKQKETLKRES